MSDIDERRDQLTVVARHALVALEARLDRPSKDLVDEFIDNFEFEVAMQWMYDAALRNELGPLSAEQESALEELSKAMNVELQRGE